MSRRHVADQGGVAQTWVPASAGMSGRGVGTRLAPPCRKGRKLAPPPLRQVSREASDQAAIFSAFCTASSIVPTTGTMEFTFAVAQTNSSGVLQFTLSDHPIAPVTAP